MFRFSGKTMNINVGRSLKLYELNLGSESPQVRFLQIALRVLFSRESIQIIVGCLTVMSTMRVHFPETSNVS